MKRDTFTQSDPVNTGCNSEVEAFAQSLIASDAMHVNRTTDACNWKTPEGVQVFHERTHVPWSPFKPMTVHYWSKATYADRALAESDAKQFNGTVEKEFYCDDENPSWFIVFDDFNNAAAHALKFLTP